MLYADDIKAVVLTGAENFFSGGDVHEIIGPLTKLDMPGLLAFTRMTGDVVKAMRACPQPVIAAIDGVCAGAGALLALGSDMDWARLAVRRRFYLPEWDWRVVTWVPARCCLVSSGKAVLPNCCLPVAP